MRSSSWQWSNSKNYSTRQVLTSWIFVAIETSEVEFGELWNYGVA
jgi:hypothetical protein